MHMLIINVTHEEFALKYQRKANTIRVILINAEAAEVSSCFKVQKILKHIPTSSNQFSAFDINLVRSYF